MKRRVHCVIMGGRGTRLLSIDQTSRCKPAVPLAGKYRLVDIPISNCLNSGYNHHYLLSQFNTASLHRHVQDAYRFDRFGKGFVEILSAEQTEHGDDWYQGTADAVRRNLIHFHADPDDLFVILLGDQLYRMDFSKMVAEHLERKAASGLPQNQLLCPRHPDWVCSEWETRRKSWILSKSPPTPRSSRDWFRLN